MSYYELSCIYISMGSNVFFSHLHLLRDRLIVLTLISYDQSSKILLVVDATRAERSHPLLFQFAFRFPDAVGPQDVTAH